MPESPAIPVTIALPKPPKVDNLKAVEFGYIDIARWSYDFSRAVAQKMQTITAGIASGKITATVLAAAHSGGYAQPPTAGTALTFLRSDAKLQYPEALGVATDRSKQVVLTDDATEGALLTAGATFSTNALAIHAPNATANLRVGKWGNLALGDASTGLSDDILINARKTNFSSAADIVAMVGQITQLGSGPMTGLRYTATMTPAAPNSNRIIGFDLISSISGANGTGAQTCMALLYFTTGLATRGDIKGIRLNPGAFFQNTSVNHYGVKGEKPTSNQWGTLTNNYWFYGESLTGGTNRIGAFIEGITLGTPTVAYGFQSALHSVGTTRRSFWGGNSFFCDSNDYITNTAAKGLIVKDGQGTPHFWRFTVGSDGTPAVVDIGTTAPTT